MGRELMERDGEERDRKILRRNGMGRDGEKKIGKDVKRLGGGMGIDGK